MGYVLMFFAISNVVLALLRMEELQPWLVFTAITTAALLASRLARGGAFGRELQTQIIAAPVWQIFGLAVALLLGEDIIIRNVTDPGISLVSRRILGPISFALIVIGAEAAIIRKMRKVASNGLR